MRNPKISLITGLCLALVLAQACKPATRQTQVNQEEVAQATPESLAREQILVKLNGYYASLSAKNIDARQYFAPNVEHFFNAANLSPDQVGNILKDGYANVEGRKVKINPATLAVTIAADGSYVATFEGDQSYTRVQDGSLVEEHFQNQITFDNTYRIIAYQSLEAGGRGLAARLPGATSVGPAFLENMKAGNTQALEPYINAQTGCVLVLQPGAFPVPTWITSVKEIYTNYPALSARTKISCNLQMEALPAFDCENGFTKQGCFMAGVPGYNGLSVLIQDLSDSGVGQYSAADIQKARDLESHIEMKLVDTQSMVSLYLGRVEGKWYVLAINMSEFSCEA